MAAMTTEAPDDQGGLVDHLAAAQPKLPQRRARRGTTAGLTFDHVSLRNLLRCGETLITRFQ